MSDTYDIPHALAGLSSLADMAGRDFHEGCRAYASDEAHGREMRNEAVMAAGEALDRMEPIRQRLMALHSRGLL